MPVHSAQAAWERMSSAEQQELLERVAAMDADMFALSEGEKDLLETGGAGSPWDMFPAKVQQAIALRLTVDHERAYTSSSTPTDTCPACMSMVRVMNDYSGGRLDRSDERFLTRMEGKTVFTDVEVKRIASLFSEVADRE